MALRDYGYRKQILPKFLSLYILLLQKPSGTTTGKFKEEEKNVFSHSLL